MSSSNSSQYRNFESDAPPSYDESSNKGKHVPIDVDHHDLEAQPNFGDDYLARMEHRMRMNFIQKVYAILSLQLIVTVAIAALMMSLSSTRQFLISNTWFMYTSWGLALATLICLICVRHHHPANLVLLCLFTIVESIMIGCICCFYQTNEVLEAFAITVVATVSLTLMTFAIKDRVNLSVLGPALFAGLMVLLVWGIFQWLWPIGPIGRTVYCLLGALIFVLYIVYDTWRLAKVLSEDEYILASIELYLDVLNLFSFILQIIGRR